MLDLSVGNADIVRLLLAAGANTEVRDEDGEDGLTPLFLTECFGCNDITRLLIDAGANVNRFVAWRGGKASDQINEVTLRRAQLVL